MSVPTALSGATANTRTMRASATPARSPSNGVGLAKPSWADTRNATTLSGRMTTCPVRLAVRHITISWAAGPAATLNATCFSTMPIAAMTVADPTRSPNVTPTRACPAASVAITTGWMLALIPVNVTASPESGVPAESRASNTSARGSCVPTLPRCPPPETKLLRSADTWTMIRCT
ncbi:MAG: hypothetical protein DMD58_10580 [Gemmatimonadetes bacterium]|nr:MAG: hypothetical protein DMD58_10580 [Gemmatimonadota bacterium]